MIKLSLQSLSYRDTLRARKLDLPGLIEKAYELRLDGVDLHSGHFASTEPAYLETIRFLAVRRGLHICYIGVSNDFGKPGADLEEQVQLVKDWTDVAARLGVPMVRVFGAWMPAGEDAAETWSRLVRATNRVVEYARSRRVVLGLHNHNHGCVPATGSEVVRLLESVHDRYYTHILDTGQFKGSPGASGRRGNPDPDFDLYESIRVAAPRAVHVRAKIYRIASGEEKWLDYDRIMPVLKELSFNGWMSVVFEGQDELEEDVAVPRAVLYLRRLLKEYAL
ncbi:MAG: sugar phosphate isomerase/epimerase [Chloroflexi bacterium]|nr:sugar phosphate isomerase/epimerase [Chloroflexota bacterium]